MTVMLALTTRLRRLRPLCSVLLRLLGCALLLGAAAVAHAHPVPFSYLDLHLRDGRVDGVLSVHAYDAGRVLGLAPPERVLQPVVLARGRAALVRTIDAQMRIAVDGRALALRWGDVVADPPRGAIRLAFTAPAAGVGAITVGTRLFPADPTHQTFVSLYDQDTLRQQWILGPGGGERTYYRSTRQGVWRVIATFVPAGIHHILIGPDHLLFLVGLLLTGGSWGVLVRIVTAFTLGHSVTLSLAALGIVSPPARLIEPGIALTIVVVGVDNLIRGQGRDLRVWAALVFGLVHGFGFASVLREFGLPREALAWSLFSFNLGVELGQLAVVVPVATALALVRRYNIVLSKWVALVGSVVVSGAGAYWFVQRILWPEGG